MEDIKEHYKYMPRPHAEEDMEIQREAAEEETAVEVVTVETEPAETYDSTEETATHAVEKEETLIPGFDMWFLKGVYNIVSPLLVPTFATMLIFFFSMLAIVAPNAVLPYSLTVFGVTGFLPFIAFFILRRIGSISSFQMFDRGERILPYIIMIMALGAITIFFVAKGANTWIWTIYCGATATAIVNFVLNFKFRICNHCSAAAGLLAALIVIQTYGLPQEPLYWWAIGILLFGGIGGSLAIYIGKHSVWEVLAGYATGFLGVILFSLIS